MWITIAMNNNKASDSAITRCNENDAVYTVMQYHRFLVYIYNDIKQPIIHYIVQYIIMIRAVLEV